tara:strand:+ start:4769 stop:5791 length:1023 start_codon:yes stop_codon:yes gene_type:complete
MKDILGNIKHKLKVKLIRIEQLFKKSSVSSVKPIFIWGLGRGGTTLLMDIFSLHDDLCYSYTKGKRQKKGLWGDLHYKENDFKINKKEIPVEGLIRNWNNTGYDFSNFNREIKRDFLNSSQKKIVKKNYATLKQSWFFSQNKKKYRIMDKAGYIIMVDLIDDIFPDAFHIFSIRDPRNVINSIMRLIRFTQAKTTGLQWKKGVEAYKFDGWEEIKNKGTHQILSWQICKALEIGFDWKKKLGQRCIVWRHEYLYKNPKENISKLFEKVDLPVNSDFLEKIPPSFKDYSTSWPRKVSKFKATFDFCFNSKEFEEIKIIERKAIELGYDKKVAGKLCDYKFI